jgi:metal-responsive CopG/Arc/MetJ family transcriptional regulator
MAKINISIPDALLAEVDSLAAALHESRSGLVQEAAARYVASVREEIARTERRASIERALASARALSEQVEPFDSTAAIRADRDRAGRKAGDP